MKPDWVKRCVYCGHTWRAIVEHPVVCPRCKKYGWDKQPEEEKPK